MSENMRDKGCKKADVILLTVLFTGILILFLLQAPWSKDLGGSVVVTVDGDLYDQCPLSEDRVIEIKNDAGEVTNTLLIHEGTVKMTNATCPDHYCLQQKKISHNGETIVCLPNRVVVTIADEASKEDAASLDAIVR